MKQENLGLLAQVTGLVVGAGIIAAGLTYREHGRERFIRERDRYLTAPTTEQRRKTIEDICPPDIYLSSPAQGYHDSEHIDCIPKKKDFNSHLPEKIVCDHSQGFWDCYENWLR